MTSSIPINDRPSVTSSRSTTPPFSKNGERGPSFSLSILAIVVGQLVSGLVTLGMEVIYARALGPAARGIIGLCMVTIAFGTLVGGLGGEGAIVYWTSRHKHSRSSYLAAVLIWGAAGCLLACGLWIAGFSILHLPFFAGMSRSVGLIILASIPVATLFAYAMALAGGHEKFRQRAVCSTGRQVFGMLTFLTLLLLVGPHVEAALWGNFAGLLAGTVATVFLLRREIAATWATSDVARSLKPTLTYALRGQVGNLATFFTYRLDIFIVNYFLSPAEVGFYALGVAISEALWQVPQAAASALFPRTARQTGEDATEFTAFVLRQVLWMNMAAGIAIALCGPILVPLVFGRRFEPSVAVIWWILPGTIALSLGKVACADLAGRGKNGYASVFALICFVVTVLLDWKLIPKMGINGAALASTVAYALDAFLVLLALRHETSIPWKSILVPQTEDLRAYRGAFNRLQSVWQNLLTSRSLVPTGPVE